MSYMYKINFHCRILFLLLKSLSITSQKVLLTAHGKPWEGICHFKAQSGDLYY